MPEAKSKVRLIDYTQNPEHTIATMARLCYADNEKVKELFNGRIDSVDDSKMIKMLAKMKHLSPFEHASWIFELEGISRAMTHQLVRHRVASYSQRSQRYVEQKNFDFIIPPTIKKAGLQDRYEEMMKTMGDFYEELFKGLEERIGLEGEEINQDARYVLPNACETKIGVTMNARELLHVFQERLCNRAQWEIREVFYEMFSLAYPTAPNVFEMAGPSCYSEKKCFQGRKSCGRAEEVKFKLDSLKKGDKK
jgi:thymidylate synthase (FAD)